MVRDNSSNRFHPIHFSLQTLFAVILLAAAYFAGWVSHREWNKQNVEKAILEATARIASPVRVEVPTDASGVVVLKGRQDEISAVEDRIREVDAAARK